VIVHGAEGQLGAVLHQGEPGRAAAMLPALAEGKAPGCSARSGRSGCVFPVPRGRSEYRNARMVTSDSRDVKHGPHAVAAYFRVTLAEVLRPVARSVSLSVQGPAGSLWAKGMAAESELPERRMKRRRGRAQVPSGR